MAFSGIRLGMWDYLKWGHNHPIEKDRKIVAAKVIVYPIIIPHLTHPSMICHITIHIVSCDMALFLTSISLLSFKRTKSKMILLIHQVLVFY